MPSNPLFERTVTALLAGEVLCEYRHEDLVTYLLVPENQERVADFLSQLSRTLRQTGNKDAWLCAYQDLSVSGAREGVRQQFREVANHLESLVAFLRLVMNVETNDRPIAPGEHLYESQLIEQIAGTPTLEEKLRSLTEKRLFSTKKPDVAGRIRVVMETLVNKGYLVRFGTSGNDYQATGKFSWLYDMMSFIQNHEGIPEDAVDEDNQMRLT
ncbi:condensin complex protein MksE [Marinobacter persicus]|uniref:Uncharacterized protein n=1 Tax=Marinobacter persicus TaxID=930118 RepID=A0A2S6G245_9GAMM|nr:hypothetical protein [Marinobacter persicus]PPK49903.1 hypothetical protein BY455_1436 [Marinobacter persicus]PPK51579.1 hypothetical protein B0H24_10446 [Marinobacter persicus]PPK56026.1 hypothetical protein BY454_1446 [Marinobacter persicus]